jgi:regulator of protease activity HflC (stomatin/prohibitin superfamily)
MSDNVQEKDANYLPGWLVLPVWLIGFGLTIWSFVSGIVHGAQISVVPILLIPVWFLLAKGFIILQPNIAVVLTFFGHYTGSLRRSGFSWINPLSSRQRISLRAYNLNTHTLKVNDRAGNPVEVAAVIVWRVADTARATFDVEDYVTFITIQSESAVRTVVSARWYDGDEHGRNSLRGDLDSVAQLLTETIQEHASLAGLEVVEARISHLAYAPEIAGAMLRRQQAQAVVAARTHIVEGAVGMVKLALDHLQSENIVTLSDADRTKLVTNLLTVLVSEGDTQPVLPLTKE